MDSRDLDSSGVYLMSVEDFEARAQPLAKTRDGALLAALREQLQAPDLAWARAPRFLARGAESTVLELWLTGREFGAPLVVRLLEAGDAAQTAREAAVQGALAASGFPAPRPIAHGGGVPGTLQPFLVMERLPGRILFSLLPAMVAATIALVAAGLAVLGLVIWVVWFVVPVLLQRKMHALPVAELQRHLVDLGLEPSELGLAAWFARFEAELARHDLAGLEPGLAWLRANSPGLPNTSLCHGDYWAGNILVSPRGVSGLIDWSNATLATPEFDVAWSRVQGTGDMPTAHNLTDPGRSRLAWFWQPLAWIGTHPHAWVYRLFGRLDSDALDYYTAFHGLRILIWSYAQEAATKGALNPWSSQRARSLVRRRFARITGVRLPSL